MRENIVTLGDRIRRAREAKGWAQQDLADRIGMSQQAVDAIEKGRSERPRKLDIIAKVLGTTEEWLLFGSGILRENEVKLLSTIGMQEVPSQKVPVLSWQVAKQGKKALKVADLSKLEFIPCLAEHSEESFGLVVKNDAMVSPSPAIKSYHPGDYIVIDPNVSAEESDLVLVNIPDAPEAIFMQYVLIAGHPYLKPFNPQYDKIKLEPEMQIVGVIVGYYRKVGR